MEETETVRRAQRMEEGLEEETEKKADVVVMQEEEEREEKDDQKGQKTELFCTTATPPMEQTLQQGFLLSGVSTAVRCEDKVEANNQYEESVLSSNDCGLRNVATDDNDCGQNVKCEDKNECEFRCGVCKLHKVKGKKYTIEERK